MRLHWDIRKLPKHMLLQRVWWVLQDIRRKMLIWWMRDLMMMKSHKVQNWVVTILNWILKRTKNKNQPKKLVVQKMRKETNHQNTIEITNIKEQLQRLKTQKNYKKHWLIYMQPKNKKCLKIRLQVQVVWSHQRVKVCMLDWQPIW